MTEDNKRLIRRMIEQALNGGRLELLETIIADDFLGHDFTDSQGRTTTKDAVQYRQTFAAMRRALSGLEFTIEDLIAEGDKVVARMTARGRLTGEFFGFPPTGEQVALPMINIFRVAGGRVVERWGQANMAALARADPA